MEERKCSCVKEPTGKIPIMRVIDKLDSLFAKDDQQEAGRLLRFWENEAKALGDQRGLLEILSEQIGYYRSLNDKENGLRAVDEALSILNCVDDGSSVSYATIYLNCATTMKAFGKVDQSLEYYNKSREVYEKLLPADDFRLAGFYNNYATALVELRRFDEARQNYGKAIDLLKQKGGCGELAVSYVNLAQLAYDEAQESGSECDEEVDNLLSLAMNCLDDSSLERDGHYASVCKKCASAFGFFGYFLQKTDLEERAQAIFNRK